MRMNGGSAGGADQVKLGIGRSGLCLRPNKGGQHLPLFFARHAPQPRGCRIDCCSLGTRDASRTTCS